MTHVLKIIALEYLELETWQPNLTKVTAKPLDQESTVTPEHTMEVKPPNMPETPTQPPEPPKEVVIRPPVYQEVTLSTPGQDEAQHSTSPIVTGLSITPVSTTEAEPSTVLTSTASSSEHPEVTLPHLDQMETQQTNPAEVTVKLLDQELTMTSEQTREVKPSPTMQETPTQSLDLEFVVTSATTSEVEHPVALERMAAPHPDQIQTQPPIPTEVTIQVSDSDITVTQNSLPNYNMEQEIANINTDMNTSICELCTCRDETLSCVGLSPEKRLHRVPVQEPEAYNGTFTVL
ncbi:leucine-rich repeat-containing protein 37B-like [Nycticebus coucang]|uniref:leucine-rich repeat-containing protein 37B-like n=1 Tax=Nycticebus coucang TaxID=9470 RepID=UPI00234D6D74|nr:leucine-rich repeat-containing protein 37B-like [Nycticebus coucang]